MINNSNATILSATIVASAIVLSSFMAFTRTEAPSQSPVANKPNVMPSEFIQSIPTNLPGVRSTPGVITGLPSVSPLPSLGSIMPSPIGQTSAYIPPLSPKVVKTPDISSPSIQPIPIPRLSRSVAPLPVVKNGSSRSAQRPAADRFVRNYYSKLKSAQYQNAWHDLSQELQNDRTDNPGGYSGEYLKWWSSFGQHTRVGKIETVKMKPDQAIVLAHCRFHGNTYVAQYFLKYDKNHQSWKIAKIKKSS